jgi:hypothetical protein
MRIRASKDKALLIAALASLIIVGFCYAMVSAQDLADSPRLGLMELLPGECRVLDSSKGVLAGVELPRGRAGHLLDKAELNLAAKNVYAGAHAEFCITAQNTSNITLALDKFKMEIDHNNDSLADLIFFSGTVKVTGFGGKYHDRLGSFHNVSITELSHILTAIMEYRKIEPAEKVILELRQQFSNDRGKFAGATGLSYKLLPTFVQYFPADEHLSESEREQ